MSVASVSALKGCTRELAIAARRFLNRTEPTATIATVAAATATVVDEIDEVLDVTAAIELFCVLVDLVFLVHLRTWLVTASGS